MKTQEILRELDEAIQVFINHKDNLPGTAFCSNVDKLINLKCELLQQVNGVNTENEKALPIHIVRVCAWAEATEPQKEPFIDKAAELAQDTLFCSRVWSAWGYGTMTADDFSDAADDEDFIDAIACAIWEGY